MLKIKTISIKGIGPIKDLDLIFNPNFNIICGTNGIGKTTILECIAHSFGRGGTYILKKNADSQTGTWETIFRADGEEKSFRVNLSIFDVGQVVSIIGASDYSDKVIVFKTNRDITYRNIESVEKDPQRDKNITSSMSIQGMNFNYIKSWFINRFLWSAQEGVITEEQKNNFQLAKSVFSVLDPAIAFERIKPSNDIMIKTPSGVIYYEYLSSGYKSALSILLGLITEIEFRFKDPTINVTDFDGIIIIDELDLHLHPEFQDSIYRGLKKIVPKAQVFTTTHSPHIIQVAEPNEIIALEISGEDKMIRQKELKNKSIGYKGWTLEEILTDIIGVGDTKSQEYYDKIRQFDMAVDEEDIEGAKNAYGELKKILHPRNEIIRLLQIQLAGMGVTVND